MKYNQKTILNMAGVRRIAFVDGSCALIICDYNGGRIVKISQQKPQALEK